MWRAGKSKCPKCQNCSDNVSENSSRKSSWTLDLFSEIGKIRNKVENRNFNIFIHTEIFMQFCGFFLILPRYSAILFHFLRVFCYFLCVFCYFIKILRFWCKINKSRKNLANCERKDGLINFSTKQYFNDFNEGVMFL